MLRQRYMDDRSGWEADIIVALVGGASRTGIFLKIDRPHDGDMSGIVRHVGHWTRKHKREYPFYLANPASGDCRRKWRCTWLLLSNPRSPVFSLKDLKHAGECVIS
jgi:hypothetical protein